MSATLPKPLSQTRAWSCVLVNQLATPGLGSLMGRRIWAGVCQLLLALAGSGFLMGWMWQFFNRRLLLAMDEPVPQYSYDWLVKWGILFFGASWLWALVTSISLLRQAKAEEQAGEEQIPPRITRPPPANPGSTG